MSDNRNEWQELSEQPLPRYALEESLVGRLWLLDQNEPLYPRAQPESEIQALMEAAPNEPERLPQSQLDSVVSDRIDHIVDTVLTDEERAVIEVTVFAGHSIRKASEILGYPRSTVHRLKQSALKIIERELRNDDQTNG